MTALRAQLVAALTLVSLSPALSAQASGGAATSQSEHRPSLAEYEGVFAYHGNATIALVATDTMLYAVLDDAKYPLRFLGAASGAVSGFVERGVFSRAAPPSTTPRSPRSFAPCRARRARDRTATRCPPRSATGASYRSWCMTG